MIRFPFIALLIAVAAQAQAERPLSPAEALKSFRLHPGLRVELVAAEPTVVDPVAMAFDEQGRIFVVENRGYPTGPKPGESPAGVIALLEDADRDGRYEKRTEFAGGLTFPNGLMRWKDGLFVTCAPDLLFLRDTNHDGRADTREVIFTGFDASNTTQLRVSHPTLNMDNWIYLASGLVNAKVARPGATNVLELRTDFRFRPDLSRWEAAEGRAQFGLTFDDFGRRFICMNRVHVQHVVLPGKYLRRDPFLGLTEPVHDCPESMEPEPLPGHRAAARIYPISQNITTADSHAGTFTAACGVTIYRGSALPREYHGAAFACDPAANLVHGDELVPTGATFAARPLGGTNEFVASTDNWFRPVFLANGPDGALYICDMYRATIEHPQYLPEEIRKRTDFEAGKGMGRIYRVTAKAAAGQPAFPRVNDNARLIALLEHSDGWWRDTAHRLLLEQRAESTLPLLRETAAKSRSAYARAHALNLLDALGGLDEAMLLSALRDSAAGVREHAMRLGESRVSDALIAQIVKAADDPDARVRLQCAASLGEISRAVIVEPLVTIALRDSDDRWARLAVLSAIGPHDEPFVERLFQSAAGELTEGRAELLRELGRVLGSRSRKRPVPGRIAAAITNTQQIDWLVPFLAGWSEEGPAPSLSSNVLSKAAVMARDASRPLPLRAAAVKALGLATWAESREPLLACLAPAEPPSLQSAAVRAIAQSKDDAAVEALLEAGRSFSPATRSALIAALMREPRHLPKLLAAIESGIVPAGALTSTQRKQLAAHPETKARAEKLFQPAGDRAAVFEEYKSVLALKPNPANGKAVFKQHCASCHRLDREGIPVGPDLFGIRNQEREVILLHIIIPEHEITPGFASYRLVTTDGRELEGMIAAETDRFVRLRRAQGEEESVPRDHIASIEPSGLSLMPQELEKNMTRQDMADLLAYLKGM